jgi:acyl carrier protein
MTVSVKKILEIFEKSNLVTDVSELDIDKPLSEQGVDSLDISNVFLNIEEALDIEIPDEDIDDLETVSKILDYINKEV